jgi:hypothetical protein
MMAVVDADLTEGAFNTVTSAVGAHLSLRGFKARRRLEWRTPSRVPVQRVTLSLLGLRGTGSGYVEAFAGVNFPDVERLAAKLQQSTVRPEFFTCSRNLGLLRLGGTRLQWLLAAPADLPSIVEAITCRLDALLPPFFEDFASLMPLYDAGDPRVCAGTPASLCSSDSRSAVNGFSSEGWRTPRALSVRCSNMP